MSKSKYIKSLLKSSSFDNKSQREKVFDLIKLEQLIIDGAKNCGDAMLSQTLHERYPKEFEIILKEVDKKGYQKWLKKQKALKNNANVYQQQNEYYAREEEKQQRELWIKMEVRN